MRDWIEDKGPNFNYWDDEINAEFCVLVDWSCKNLYNIHIEPLHNFRHDRGNQCWKLHKRNLTKQEAWDWVSSKEAEEILRESENIHSSRESKNNKKRSYARKNQTGKQKIDRATRFKIFKRDGYRCQICGRSQSDDVVLEVDHKIPRSKGGDYSMENLWTLCFDCNRGKRDRDL